MQEAPFASEVHGPGIVLDVIGHSLGSRQPENPKQADTDAGWDIQDLKFRTLSKHAQAEPVACQLPLDHNRWITLDAEKRSMQCNVRSPARKRKHKVRHPDISRPHQPSNRGAPSQAEAMLTSSSQCCSA